MKVQMHFATFLKLLTLSAADKIRDLERYAKPGGFDFYRPSREGVTKYCAGTLTKDQAVKRIETSSSPNSVVQNKEIFEKVSTWLGAQPRTATMPNRGMWHSPQKMFSVHIEPEIAYKGKNGHHVIAVYPRKAVRINRDQAGAGLILLRRGYRGCGAEKFGILDAFESKVLRTPTNVSERLLENEIATIEAELARIL